MCDSPALHEFIDRVSTQVTLFHSQYVCLSSPSTCSVSLRLGATLLFMGGLRIHRYCAAQDCTARLDADRCRGKARILKPRYAPYLKPDLDAVVHSRVCENCSRRIARAIKTLAPPPAPAVLLHSWPNTSFRHTWHSVEPQSHSLATPSSRMPCTPPSARTRGCPCGSCGKRSFPTPPSPRSCGPPTTRSSSSGRRRRTRCPWSPSTSPTKWRSPSELPEDYTKRARQALPEDVLSFVKEGQTAADPRVITLYQKDNETFSAWTPPPAPASTSIPNPTRAPTLLTPTSPLSPFNCDRFSYDPANLCCLMEKRFSFPGFSSSSWYVKTSSSLLLHARRAAVRSVL